MSLTTYTKRTGTSDQGKDYEWLLCTFYSLTFALNPDIVDFQLYTNSDFSGAFDDVILRVKFKDGSVKVFLLQQKHSEQAKNVTLDSLEAEDGHFSLRRYQKSFDKTIRLPNFVYILYTNKVAKFRDKTCLNLGGEEVFIRHSEVVGGKLLNTSRNQKLNSVFRFESQTDSGFFQHFYLFANQRNVTSLDYAISELLQSRFQTDIKSLFVVFMRCWYCGKFVLYKSDIVAKLTELVLSPMVQTVTCDFSNEKTKLLQDAILKFDLSLIDPSAHQIANIWSNRLGDKSIKDVSLTALKFGLIPRGVYKLEDLPLEKQAMVAWYLNLVPLVVKIDESRRKQLVAALLLLKQTKMKKVILMGPLFEELSQWEVFKDLSDMLEGDATRSAILQTFTCSLQGRRLVPLGDLAPTSVFTLKQLLQIAIDDVFRIGEPLEPLPPIYIQRYFTKIFFDWKILDDLKNDSICVSCNGREDLVRMRTRKRLTKITSTVATLEHLFKKNYIYAGDKFPKALIDEKHRKFAVEHHFQVVDQQLQWLSSIKVVKEVAKYRKSTPVELFPESHLDDNFQSNVKIVTSHSGSGKTCLLNSIKNGAPPNCLVLKLDLKHHSQYFQTDESPQIWDYVTDFTINSRNYNEFESNLVKKFDKMRCQVLWDGFDELASTSRINFIKGVKVLKSLGVSQWITTKNHLKDLLEEKLGVFALSMQPFRKSDQRYYLEERCGVTGDLLEQNFFKNVQILDDQEYLGVPLQLYIITDIFNEDRRLLESVYTLTDMFHAFIEGRYRHFLAKTPNSDLVLLQSLIADGKEHRLEQYQIAAMRTFIPEVPLENNDRFINDIRNGDFLGLISREDPEGGFVFEHKIVGEYLCALYLSRNFGQIGGFIFWDKYRNIRFLFDLLMADKDVFVSILYKRFDGTNDLTLKDKAGRNPLHLLCSYGEKHPLLKSSDSYEFGLGDSVCEDGTVLKETVQKVLLECNPLEKCSLGWTSFDYADRSLSLGLLEVIGGTRGVLPTLCNYNDLPTVLYYSIRFNYQNLFGAVQKDVVFVEDSRGTNLLHVATQYGREQFLTWLLSQKIYLKSINKSDGNYWTPIQIASFNGNLTFLKYLQTKGATFPISDPSLMSLATAKGCRAILDFLIECDCSTNEFYHFDYLTRSLTLAISHGYLEIVEILIQNGVKFYGIGKNHQNALHMALGHKQYDIARLLLGHGIDIDSVDDNGMNCCHQAAQNNQKGVMEFLLERKADFRALDERGRSPLHWAAHAGALEVAKVLVEAGVDVNKGDKDEMTPLHLAVLSGQAPLVTFLLTKADPKCHNRYRKTPLHFAAMNDLGEVITALLDHGAIIDAKESLYGRTPLHYASWNGHDACVKILLDRGAKMDPCSFGYTPLHLAAECDSAESCLLLLQAGAKYDTANRNGVTPLDVSETPTFMTMMRFSPNPVHIATIRGKFECIPEILSWGFDVNQLYDGTTPLNLAVDHWYSPSTVKTLLSLGCDIHQRDKDGYSVLHHALQSSTPRRDTIEVLLSHGGEKLLDMETPKGVTPLHIAAQGGSFTLGLYDSFKEVLEEIVVLLINKGAKIDAVDEDGFTPLHYAAQSGDLNTVKLLVGEVNQPNRYGRTALHMAAIKGNVTTVEFLLEKGALQMEDQDGDTPLDDAYKSEHPKVIKVLTKEYGRVNDKGRNIMHMAAKQGFLDLVEFFLNEEFQFDTEDQSGCTPLEEALYNRQYKPFEVLLDHSTFDVNKFSKKYQKYPLHAVTSNKTVDLAKIFLERGAKVDIVDQDGNTPLHYCSQYCNYKILSLLLDHMDNNCVNIQNNKGETILHLFAQERNFDTVEKLLDKGFDVNLTNTKGDTVLDVFFNQDYLRLEEKLLFKMNQVDLKKQNKNGNTLLHLAASNCTLETVRWLVEKGSCVNTPNNDGRTPFTLSLRNPGISRYLLETNKVTLTPRTISKALTSSLDLFPLLVGHLTTFTKSQKHSLLEEALIGGNHEIFKRLWDQLPGVDVANMATGTGYTPLHLFAAEGDLEGTKRLLAKGLKINEADKSGVTPVDIAAKEGRLEVLELLLDHDKSGLFRYKSDGQGCTLLHTAARRGKNDVVELLLRKGFSKELYDREGKTAFEEGDVGGRCVLRFRDMY